MIQRSIAPTVPEQPLSQESGYDPKIHRSNCARTTSVPRIRLWSKDPSLHCCQTNLYPKNQAMLQWSIAPTVPEQPLSQGQESRSWIWCQDRVLESSTSFSKAFFHWLQNIIFLAFQGVKKCHIYVLKLGWWVVKSKDINKQPLNSL